MDIKKMSLIIPAIIFMSPGAFAGEGSSAPPPQYQSPAPAPDYDDGCYDQGCGGPVYQDPCNTCGGVVVVTPPPPPPPVIYNPGINYYCGVNCLPPVLPYPQPIMPYPIHRRPLLPPPLYGRGPIFGPRPGFRGGPIGRPMPPPRYRRMSAAGCEVQQGNSGEFAVISAEGEVLFTSKVQHADQNADYMKSYYEKNSDLCGGVNTPSKFTDI